MKQQALTLLRQALAQPEATFRAGQWEAISALVQDNSQLLVVQRTGWGKSVVYFLATRLLRDQGKGPTLLISPLLALMRNQVEMAERLGVRAATINSTNREEWKEIQARLLGGDVDILLVSPERLANDEFREQVLMPLAGAIGLFVVDEAHCISDWGHDFRPDYRRITRILQALPPNIPVLATTATANDRVVNDVQTQLGPRLILLRGPLGRASLRLQNIHLPSQAARMAWLAEHLPALPGSGIIYTLTIRDAQRLATWLQSEGIQAFAYWGGLDNDSRVDLEQKLLDNRIKALVATSALGMGFDKPDLGFVIHFQRPGSVVHYYQQVGRAGRALDEAYGIMLSGAEDEDITDYFIRTAFPPEGHTREVLAALNDAEDGLSLPKLEGCLNLRRGQIEKVLKVLAVETPAPIVKRGSRWYATAITYTPDDAKITRLTEIRRQEQARMREYLSSSSCLMAFLGQELDDPEAEACGRCSPCVGQPLLPEGYSLGTANRAVEFLRRNYQVIEPRKQWPGDALIAQGWQGTIPASLRTEEGRALCLWGDAGWGELVKQGKQVQGRFADELVAGVVDMVKNRWQPTPFPTWVTCVPSLNHPTLVPDFALRVAEALALPFIPCVEKLRSTRPQKQMQNSYQQANNLAGAYTVRKEQIQKGPVFLVDDMVDSRWTMTVIAALLREAGAGLVFPLALALTTAAE
ncbi:MAG: RecQ family ATP-dependent DNA helicase [Deltaproteobacteria bacterium]|nr:RecQ family ATP-dependent DNA helicase [Deltaproteobacteria bacterium]